MRTYQYRKCIHGNDHLLSSQQWVDLKKKTLSGNNTIIALLSRMRLRGKLRTEWSNTNYAHIALIWFIHLVKSYFKRITEFIIALFSGNVFSEFVQCFDWGEQRSSVATEYFLVFEMKICLMIFIQMGTVASFIQRQMIILYIIHSGSSLFY